MYQPRGTRTVRRLREFRQASQARRALFLAAQEAARPTRADAPAPVSFMDLLLEMAREGDADGGR